MSLGTILFKHLFNLLMCMSSSITQLYTISIPWEMVLRLHSIINLFIHLSFVIPPACFGPASECLTVGQP